MGRIGLIICILLLATTGGAIAANVKDELQGVNKEIREKKLLLKKNRKVETQVSGEVEKISRNLRDKEARLATLKRDLAGADTSLKRTQQEIETARGEAERKKQEIRLRLASLYKAGELGGTRVFFSSESFPQMMENMRYMKAVLAHDQGLFADYNARMERLKSLKSSLEGEVARKEQIRVSIEAKKQEIEADKQAKVAYLQKIREDKKGYLTSLRELEANARRLKTLVERLEARSRKVYTGKSVEKKRITGGPSLPPVSDKGFGALKGRLAMPARGEIVGSFGRHKHPEFNSYTMSNGISIAAPLGTDVHAVYDGQVIFADYFKGYGNMIIVDHGGGFFSLYAHAGRIMKKVGTTVSRNEVVASVGDVDSSKGPLLYFEIRYQGKPVDPTPWFK